MYRGRVKPTGMARLVLAVGLTTAMSVSGCERLGNAIGGRGISGDSADRGFRFQTARASTKVFATVERKLESEGIIVSPAVRRALTAMIGIWEHHDDVMAAHSLPDGSPDVASLVHWSLAARGANEVGMVPFLGGVRELGGRMGLLLDSQIAPVLYWTLQNEPDFREDITFVLDHLRALWESDASIPQRFTTDGVVDVLGFLKFANTRATLDPSSQAQRFDLFVVREAIHYLEND